MQQRHVGRTGLRVSRMGLAAAGSASLGHDRLASAQAEYSLLSGGVEDELLPVVAELVLGFLPAAPLGRGVLSGKYRLGADGLGRAVLRARPAWGDGADRRRAYDTAGANLSGRRAGGTPGRDRAGSGRGVSIGTDARMSNRGNADGRVGV